MKVVQGDEVPLQRGLEYRGGMFHSRRLLEGQAGAIDNFQLSIGVSQGDFYSPRHHHNFEQIRVGLEGTLDYDRDGKMSAGVVGYFPEGIYYGPQSQNPDEVATAAVLQFAGASGSGYLSNAEVRAGMEELKKHGEFKNGVGDFYAQDSWDNRGIFIRYEWSGAAAGAPHFEQAYSADGGKTWEPNWITDQSK